jgi:hypothetical protein
MNFRVAFEKSKVRGFRINSIALTAKTANVVTIIVRRSIA